MGANLSRGTTHVSVSLRWVDKYNVTEEKGAAPSRCYVSYTSRCKRTTNQGKKNAPWKGGASMRACAAQSMILCLRA